jgi:large subunit ribosomal protein L4
MIKATIHDLKGKEAGQTELSEKLFGLPWNADMVHQVIESMRSNARIGSASTKDRSEVRGGGKKPWRQKGTGRARHGSRRSPIWVGGGVTHGPRPERNYDKKINRKMKTKALFTILSAKLKDGQMIFTEPMALAKPEIKKATTLLEGLAKTSGFEKLVYRTGKRVLVITPEKDESIIKSFANIKIAHVEEARNINPLMAATYQHILVIDPAHTVDKLISRA